MDMELEAELAEFLDDSLINEFANDQGRVAEWSVEPIDNGHCAIIKLDGVAMPAVGGRTAQAALDNASVQAIEILTRHEREREPVLAFA